MLPRNIFVATNQVLLYDSDLFWTLFKFIGTFFEKKDINFVYWGIVRNLEERTIL